MHKILAVRGRSLSSLRNAAQAKELSWSLAPAQRMHAVQNGLCILVRTGDVPA